MNLSDDMLAGLLGGTISGVILSLVFGFYIFTVIAAYKILGKAGEKGWKAFIPLYNSYMLYKISNCPKYFWYTLVLAIATEIVTSVLGEENTIGSLISIILSIAIIYFDVLFCSKLSKSFGKGRGFTVGMFFFPNIFQLILGFGSSEYIENADN